MARLNDARPAARIQAVRELAAKADRAEATAIANAARGAPVDVRREVAIALGKAPAREAVDLLGPLLRDPQDEVRAAAVEALSHKGDPKAVPYIASAYVRSGPLTRAAVVQAGPAALTQALAIEAQARNDEIVERLKAPGEQLRASGLELLGASATPEAVNRLVAKLEDKSLLVVAAAARGLAQAKAADKVPLLVARLEQGSPLEAIAIAPALGELGGASVVPLLAKRLAQAQPDEALVLLDTLSQLPDDAEAKSAACQLAATTEEPSVAIAAARYVGTPCPAPAAEGTPPTPTRLFALATVRACDPQASLTARKLLPDAKRTAPELAAAATYLGVCGEAKDAPPLVALATSELQALLLAVYTKDAEGEIARAQVRAQAQAEYERMRQVYGMTGDKDALDRLPRPLGDKLSKFLLNRTGRGADLLEHRPGAHMLIASASAAAARLGGDVEKLGEGMLESRDPRVRLLAPEVVDLAGDRLSALRAKVEADPDPAVRRLLALRDLQAKREGALERLAPLVEEAPADEQQTLAEALRPMATQAKAVLLTLLASDEAPVSAAAARSLELVSGADIEEALGRSLIDARPHVALAALGSLRTRPGEAVDQQLLRASGHPDAEVRAAALTALAGRKACVLAPKLRPFASDFDGQVRAAARTLAQACPTSP